MLILVVGLALAGATQTALRGPAAQATTSTTPVQGTDVSSVQGSSINWADVAGSERFVAIKATEGNYYTDPDYQPDLTGATAAGLYVMPYVFANPYGSSASNVNAGNGWGSVQADDGWKTIGATTPVYNSSSLMLPVAVDLEPDPYVNTETNSNQCYGLTPTQMVAWIQSFIAEMKKDSGKTPIIYTSTSWWDACTGGSILFSADPLWLASWGVSLPSIPSSWINLTFWQYSDSGAVAGIGGAVDLDSLGPTQTSAVNTPIRVEQIQTLSSLEAQNLPSGYSQTGLPTGLQMSANGIITGEPTAIGQYTVTVTPPAGAVPASMSFPWDVHGAITVSNATSRSSEEGAPVSVAITASGPDQTAGFAPSFSATGLPPGLSISSTSGLITGSPTTPGTFKVTVTATDAVGGSATASFTWTVPQEATVGTSGTCLETVAGKLQPEPCSSAPSQLMRPGNG
jgi:GH25 family lysozyme M1 (1,4-beta-N-acetylmuramidase)